MPRLHALELLPDAAGEAAVRADWQRLREAGLPSMADHAGATNTPHVTVVAVPALTADDERRAVDLLGPHLPMPVRTAGLAVLGGERATLVRLVEADDVLHRAVLELRAATEGHQHPGWLAHLTLARRLRRGDLQRALDALDPGEVVTELTTLRRWDPEQVTVRSLLG